MNSGEYSSSFTVTPATALVFKGPDLAGRPGPAADGPATHTGPPDPLRGVAGDGVHVVAYFGATTGNGTYSSLDGQRVLRLAVSLDSGLAPFLLGDPAVIADITGNALVSALDATRIFQEVVGIDRPEIPLLPGVLTLVTGADPFVNIPTTLSGTPGSTVTAPIMIDNAAGLESVDVRLTYNASLLDVLAVRTGSVTAGATLLTNLNVPGVITAALALTTPRTAGAGSLIEIDYRIKSTATPGLTALNLTQVSLNEDGLVLTPAPVAGPDPTDGSITIVSSTGNTAPLAAIDSFATNEDTALTVTAPGVLANDTDVDGNSLTAVVGAGTGHRAPALHADRT